MNRTVATMAAVVAAFALTACGGDGSEGGGDAPSSAGSSSAESSSTRPSAMPSPSGTTPPSSGADASPPPKGTVPAQRPVRLLHDGASAEPGIEENTPWQQAAVKVPVCWQEVPLAGATEQRAVSALVDMERWSEGLVVFDSADRAVRFMQVARISVDECAAGDGSPWQGRMAELPGAWGDGVAISYGSSTPPSSTPGPPLGETTLVLARVGRAVTYAWRGSHGILGSRVDAGGVAELRPALDHVAPQLCRYTKAGC